MYLDSDDRRPALTPQLAIRVAAIGGVALLAFALVFFRLWYLQVLSGDKYRAEANDNRTRSIKVQAPRGQIVDRDGRVLVDNRNSLAVQITPKDLPKGRAERQRVYDRLGKVLKVSGARVAQRVERQLKALPYSAATVKQDVKLPLVSYLYENQGRFPGVQVEQVFLREYPRHKIGAHLFGTVGEITREQRKDDRYRGVALGDRVGQAGIEYQYDRFLRGKNGASKLQVDALGNLKGQQGVTRPQQGRQLRLSVDLDVQRAGQEALGGARGAFVAMNVRNGQVLGMGSSPSFDPNVFSKGVKASTYKQLISTDNGAPLTNRALQGLYPTGSTFKLITASASLMGGLITPDTVQFDGGSLRVGAQNFKNAGNASYGALALRKALTVSSDVFFYRLGQEANGAGNGLLIQKWARRYGLGRRTGIDLPQEAAGLIPTPRLRNRGYRSYRRCVAKRHPTPQQISFGRCGFFDRPWSVGDNINLSVGQGDVQVDPLQLAVAYAALANGGKVLRPRLGERIEDSAGRVQQELQAPTARRLGLKPEFRQAILDGLRGAASEPGGTSTPVFKDFPIPVAGKTGTAQHTGKADQSWYCGLAPYPSMKYVVCATFETGGFGAETAAPAVCKILGALFNASGDCTGGKVPD